jgi:histidine triad (HIT) family protein
MDCIFCKIIKGEIPSFKIYEDDMVIAFLDINPIKPGHTLVVPKKHIPTFLESDDHTLASLTLTIKKVAISVVTGLNAEGCNISINNGRAAGQDIFHLHAHIIPRQTNDSLPGWPHGEYKEGEGERLAEKIRQQITND